MSTRELVKNIVNLAGGSLNKADDLSIYDSLSQDLKDAIAEEISETKKAAARKVAKDIVHLLTFAENTVSESVEDIRSHRRKINEIKNILEKIHRAKEYGLATNNFVPLVLALRVVDPAIASSIHGSLTVIPESFVPADAESKMKDKSESSSTKKSTTTSGSNVRPRTPSAASK